MNKEKKSNTPGLLKLEQESESKSPLFLTLKQKSDGKTAYLLTLEYWVGIVVVATPDTQYEAEKDLLLTADAWIGTIIFVFKNSGSWILGQESSIQVTSVALLSK